MRVWLLILLMLAPTAALAQAGPKGRAQTLMNDGNIAANRGDYSTALQHFRAAYDLFPSVKLLLNIGTSLRQIGRHSEAARVFEEYLTHDDADPKRVEEVAVTIDQIDTVVGRVNIDVLPLNAELRLDDRTIAQRDIRVDVGEHTLTARKNGYRAEVETFTARAGEVIKLEIVLRLSDPDSDAEPDAVPSDDDGETQRVLGLVVGGVGVIGLGLGALFGSLALTNESKASDHCAQNGTTCDQEGVDLGDTAQDFATASTVSFIIGAVVLAVGGVTYLLAPSPNDAIVFGPSGVAIRF